jgi:hypothetical protein
VFSGEVIGRVDLWADREIQSTGDPIEYEFRVEKVWKGAPRKTLRVYSARAGATCGYVFQVGKRYLVYARILKKGWLGDSHDDALKGRLSASLCSRTRELADAAEDLRQLPPPL